MEENNTNSTQNAGSNKKIGFILLIVALVIVVVFVVVRLTSKDADAPTVSQQSQSQNTSDNGDNQSNDVPASTPLTLAEVQKHSTPDDCWTIISGQVYDITDYVSRHPGGDEIDQACGADATTLFTERKTSDGEEVGSGTPHSSNAESQLEDYKLGQLEQ